MGPKLKIIEKLGSKAKAAQVNYSKVGETEVSDVTLAVDHAMVTITSYGATVTHFIVQTSTYEERDLVLGFDSAQEYYDLGKSPSNPYFGCAVGRTANRIADGKFELNDKTYQTIKTHGGNNLHGGPNGLDKAFFTASIPNPDTPSATFFYTSPDGDQGFPGKVEIAITYTLHSNPISLEISYSAKLADCEENENIRTPINLTNHSYFNLTGVKEKTIHEHIVSFPNHGVDGILEVTDSQIPTGKVIPISQAPEFDFSTPKTIGKDLGSVQKFGGYDHFYMLKATTVSASHSNRANYLQMPVVASVRCSDFEMQVRTTCPGFQLYTGQWIPSVKAKKRHLFQERLGPDGKYVKFCGVAIETSFPPDSMNRSDVGWSSGVVLGKNDEWNHSTVYTFVDL
ncbi:hypothetical protein HK098_002618 [Nowakowskiella sp. JEL0407]|nr:hypothetical protein HK098_002618 [Nowakowskiella sp. JEL0407]